MFAALLISFVVLTPKGPVLLLGETNTKDVGFCQNAAYQGRDDVLVSDQPGVPAIVGCFKFDKAGIAAMHAWKEAHMCALRPIAHTFNEATGVVETATYECLKP